MEFKYSEEMKYALDEAKKLAISNHSQNVGVEHVVVAILRYPSDSTTKKLLSNYGIGEYLLCRGCYKNVQLGAE